MKQIKLKKQKSNKLVRKHLSMLFILLSLYGYSQSNLCSAKFTSQHLSNKAVAFYADPAITDKFFFWDFGDGTTSSEKNPEHTFPSKTNTYRTCLRVYSQPDSTCTDTHCEFIQVNADTISSPCSAAFTYSISGDKQLFAQAINKDSNTVRHHWDFGDGNSSSTYYGIHNYAAPGTYKVCLTTQSLIDSACRDTQCESVTINSSCKAGYKWNADPSNKNKINFTRAYTYSVYTNYLWDFGDGTTSISPDPSHIYANGTYRCCLTITDTLNKCTDTYCNSISISGCSAAFTFYKLTGSVYQFQAQQQGKKYNWNFGDGSSSDVQQPIHTYSDNLIYNVCLTITDTLDTLCIDKICHQIDNTNRFCKAQFQILPDSSTTDPFDFLIYNQSTGSGLNYLWSFGDGDTSALQTPTHHYTGTGPYMICLKVYNDSCSNTFCDSLSLSDTMHRTTGTFTIRVIDKTTGITNNTLNKSSFQSYPNPFNDRTTIHYTIESAAKVELTVFNILGNKVTVLENTTKSAGNHSLEWNTEQLPEGIYILQLRANDQVLTRKLIRNQ